MSEVAVLKIDKDCCVSPSWIRDYVNVIKTICKTKKTQVTSIEMCQSKKGEHLYIGIQPKVSAELANQLQWLLGDDCRRVDYNRARIRSRYPDWNKLFERIGQRFETLYRCKVPAGTRKTRRGDKP